MSCSSVTAMPRSSEMPVPDHDEQQPAGASRLFLDVQNPRFARHAVANPQRTIESQPSTGPHPSRERGGRHEIASDGMALGPEIGLPVMRQKIQPVPWRRQRIARTRIWIVAIQRCRQRRHRGWRNPIRLGLGLADPFIQVRPIDAHRRAVYSRRGLPFEDLRKDLGMDLGKRQGRAAADRTQPAFLTGFRREESETPSEQGARPEGTGGVLDGTSRSPTKRNAALADGSGAVADNS